MTQRFSRNYELKISLPGDRGDTVIKPPIRINFQADKSIRGQLNKIQLQIYNLKEENRLRLVRDRNDNEKIIPLELKVGYQDDLETVFKGTIHKGSNKRQGADIVTTIEGLDGGFDFLNSYTSRTVEGARRAIDACISDTARLIYGKVTDRPELTRPKVLVGNSMKLIQDMIGPDETWFIDNEQLNIVKHHEVISNFTPRVSAGTGLITTPEREDMQVTFQTLMNPSIRIGHRAELKSTTAPHLDGTYKIETISYQGDNFGDEWSQTCTGLLAANATVI